MGTLDFQYNQIYNVHTNRSKNQQSSLPGNLQQPAIRLKPSKRSRQAFAAEKHPSFTDQPPRLQPKRPERLKRQLKQQKLRGPPQPAPSLLLRKPPNEPKLLGNRLANGRNEP